MVKYLNNYSNLLYLLWKQTIILYFFVWYIDQFSQILLDNFEIGFNILLKSEID